MQMYNLNDLSELLERMGYSKKHVYEVLVSMYKKYKSEGVIKAFSELTRGEINLKHIGQNKYIINYEQN